MKKYVCLLLLAFIMLLATEVQAASNVTYFYGEAVKINDEKGNIEILLDEMIIDTRTSKVNHSILFQNNANQEIETEIVVPLENEKLSIKVKNVKMFLNGKLITPTNNNGNYSIKTQMASGEGKILEIQYETENNLKEAKVIKYNLDNLKGKTIGKEKVEIIFDEEEIPLITGIYPGHYNFDNNTISVEYYKMNVNTITREVIVEKETYHNLLYGREYELSEQEIQIVKNAKSWIENGIKIGENDVEIKESGNWLTASDINRIAHRVLKIESNEERFYEASESWRYDNLYQYTENSIIENIVKYVICKQIIQDKTYQLVNVILETQGNNGTKVSILLYDILYKNDAIIAKEDDFSDRNYYALYGEKICIDFVETEPDKQLYTQEERIEYIKDEDGYETDEIVNVEYSYTKVKERDVLKAKDTWADSFFGARVIYVGEGLDGNNLNATEEEKIEYVNSIGASLYIRDELYSGNKEDVEVGYYNNEDKEMAIKYSSGAFITEEEFIESKNNGTDWYKKYANYEEFINSHVTKLQNDVIAERCEVPTIVYFITNIKKKEDRYIVDSQKGMSWRSGVSGLVGADKVIQTERAKQLTNANKKKNDVIKKTVEDNIYNSNLLEYKQKPVENKGITQKDIIVLSTIVVLIGICVIFLIKNKKGRR